MTTSEEIFQVCRSRVPPLPIRGFDIQNTSYQLLTDLKLNAWIKAAMLRLHPPINSATNGGVYYNFALSFFAHSRPDPCLEECAGLNLQYYNYREPLKYPFFLSFLSLVLQPKLELTTPLRFLSCNE